MINAYERDRKPRLEYVASLAPSVEAVLTSVGLTVEGRLPLMTCTPGLEQRLPIPSDIELIVPVLDAAILATVTAQNEAYGAAAPSNADVNRLRNTLSAGGLAVLARVTATGEPVGGGMCSVPANQTTEIAGIGVRVPFRRRGIAGALTPRLVQEAFDDGVTLAFLMAVHESEERIYLRAGFCAIDEILHISFQHQ